MNERQLRSIIKQVIRETRTPKPRLLIEDEEGGKLYRAFVSPFVDVLKSANLFTKDILNILALTFNTLTTFSPEKLREAREAYNARQDKIAQEWRPLMDKAVESLDNSDVGIAAMVMAPNIYFGVLGAKIAGAGVETADDYLQAMGIKQYVIDKNADLAKKLDNYLETQERESNREQQARGREGLASQLRVFFFGEAAWQNGNILSEAEEDKDSSKSKSDKKPSGGGSVDTNKLVQDLFGDGGILEDLFTESQEEMLQAKKEQVDSLVGTANTIINGMRAISEAKALEDFEKAVESLKGQLGQRGDEKAVDLSPIEKAIQSLKTQMEKKYEEVIKGEGEASPAPAGAKKGDVETVAKKASQDAFEEAAGELRKMAADAATESATNYKNTISEELTSDLPKEGPLGKALGGSEAGKKLQDLIKNAINSIGTTSAT